MSFSVSFRHSLAALLAGLLTVGAARADPVTVCGTGEFWPPYNFVKDGELAGEYREILNAAFADIGMDYVWIIQPWKRCQDRVAAGELQALASISYAEDRNKTYHFPMLDGRPDPASSLGDVEFVVVTRTGATLLPGDKPTSLPQPVGVLLGYQLETIFRNAGLDIRAVSHQRALLHLLERGRIASTLLVRGTAEHFVRESRVPLMIHTRGALSAPHYLAFSRKGDMDEATMQRIWAAIANVRSDEGRMARIHERVDAMLRPCVTATGHKCE